MFTIVKSDKIYILGVTHIKPNIGKVLQQLEMLDISNNSLVFIEPKKNILLGIETCDKKSVYFFFAEVLKFIMQKKAKIASLNPKYIPSHKSVLLIQKYARQFAEEEYMADVIANTEHDTEKIVIIGDVHALRLQDLLRNKGLQTEYIKLAPLTPDDLIAKSWRAALEGKSSEFISMNWLKTIHGKIRQKMNLPKDINVQEACWNDVYQYNTYLTLVTELMEQHKISEFMCQVSKHSLDLAREAKQNGQTFLARFKNIDDHQVFSYPYSPSIYAFANST